MKCIGKLRALEFQQVCNDCWNVHTKSSPSESDKQHVCGLEAWLSKISHVLDNSYAGGFNILKRVNTCLINRRLATQHPIVRLFTSWCWKKLIAQLGIRHSSLKTVVGEDGKRRTKETVAWKETVFRFPDRRAHRKFEGWAWGQWPSVACACKETVIDLQDFFC